MLVVIAYSETLKNIKTYGKLEGGNVVLYASDGAAAMVLQKKQ